MKPKKRAENMLRPTAAYRTGSEPGQDTGVVEVQMQAAAEEKEKSGPKQKNPGRELLEELLWKAPGGTSAESSWRNS